MSGGSPVLQAESVKSAFLPALVCAVLSVVLMRTGFMLFFFLVPLGVAASFGFAAAWLACALSLAFNALVPLAALAFGASGGSVADGAFVPNILVFAALGLGFTWVMVGGLARSVSTSRRFVVAASLCALCLLGIALHLRSDPAIMEMLRSQAELVSSLYVSAGAVDAARQSVLERILSPDNIIAAAVSVSLRGGLLVLVFFLFFFSRQVAMVIARLLRRRQKMAAAELADFHAPQKAVWFLSCALAGILLGKVFHVKTVEIAAWNVCAVCAMLFLAQGGGIVLYALTRRAMSLLPRLLFATVIVLTAFRPEICMLALGVLLLLGIAENWLPLRVAKQDGSAPTPEP